jgi:hypothetical protein
VIVVSEETGGISIAQGGEMKRGIPQDDLRAELLQAMSKRPEI